MRDVVAGPAGQSHGKRLGLDGSQSFVKIGSNGAFRAHPGVIHFGGFTAGRVHEQRVRILNVGTQPQRMHVLGPTTEFFSMQGERKGRVAPGVAEEFVVRFTPRDWRYYYDTIRVHCEPENLVIPLHGYPVMNEVIFPKTIDLGSCPLGVPTRRVFHLECKVPIQFEFEFAVSKAHPDMRIYPRAGVVPAEGAVSVTVEFQPVKLCTAEMRVRVSVSQFAFEPFECVITGSAAPGAARDQELHRAAERLKDRAASLRIRGAQQGAALSRGGWASRCEEGAEEGSEGETEDWRMSSLRPLQGAFATAALREASSLPLDPSGVEQGKGDRGRPRPSADPSAELTRHLNGRGGGGRTLARTLVSLTQRPTGDAPEVGEEVLGDASRHGLRVPANLNSVTALNYVLTQEEGKLKPRDLARAIAEQRAVRAEQEAEQAAAEAEAGEARGEADAVIAAEQAALQASSAAGSGGQSRQLRELVFLQQFAQARDRDKELEVKSQALRLGEPLMSGDEAAAVRRARRRAAQARGARQRAEGRARLDAEATGPAHPSRPARACVAADASPAHVASFDPLAEVGFARRAGAVRQFREAATRRLLRARLLTRLSALRNRIKGASTREQVRMLVEATAKKGAAASTGGDEGAGAGAGSGRKEEEEAVQARLRDLVELSKGLGAGVSRAVPEGDVLLQVAAAFTVPSSSLFAEGMPQGEGEGAPSRVPAAISDEAPEFADVAFLRLRVPAEHEVVGHSAYPPPPAPCYVPTEAARLLRRGAVDDAGAAAQRGPCGADATAAADRVAALPLPTGLATAPVAEGAAYLAPGATDRVFRSSAPFPETDPRRALQPQVEVFAEPDTRGTLTAGAVAGWTLARGQGGWESRFSTLRPRRDPLLTAASAHVTALGPRDVRAGPAPLRGPAHDDELSDSESEDEGGADADAVADGADGTVPSLRAARELFGTVTAAKGEGDGEGKEGAGDKRAGATSDPADVNYGAAGARDMVGHAVASRVAQLPPTLTPDERAAVARAAEDRQRRDAAERAVLERIAHTNDLLQHEAHALHVQ